MSDSQIHTVLLDADGVAQAPTKPLVPELEALCHSPGDGEQFVADIFSAETPCLTGEAEFPVVLEEVLARWGISVPLSEVLLLWHLIRPVPQVFDLISKLRQRRIRVCLATNQQRVRAEFMANDLGYSTNFDELFFSCELGASKPKEEFFTRVIQRLAIESSEILFIDDQPKNVEAAKRSGMVGELYHFDSGAQALESILERHHLLASTGVCVDV